MTRSIPSVLAALALCGSVSMGVASAAEEDPVADWVRQTWFEGVPHDEARALDQAACDRLAELLADPAEAAHHRKAIEALGIAGRPGAFEAIAAHASAGDDRGARRTRRAVAHAMGRLAGHDDRALAWLLAHSDPRRRAIGPPADRGVLTGLALSGRSEAVSRLEAAARGEGASGRHAREALVLHGTVAGDGR